MPYKDPEKKREYQRRWREENREKKRESNQRWLKAHPEKQREYYQRWHEANHEKAREKRRRWYAENRDTEKQRSHEWHKAHPEQARENQRRWHKAHPESRKRDNHRRRAAVTESYNVMDIYARDNWTCQMCGEPVDHTLEWPHPRSRSIDHLWPFRHGGKDRASNVRLVHLAENLSKGSKRPPIIFKFEKGGP